MRRKVDELLALVHLEQFADRLPSQLSGGQRQRMALARALAVEPSVLLLDEPFGALDAKVRKELRDWLRRLHDEVHVTTVFVTHDQEEALEVADNIVVINEGRIEQIGSPDELYDQPGERLRHEVPRACHRAQRRAAASPRHRAVRRRSRQRIPRTRARDQPRRLRGPDRDRRRRRRPCSSPRHDRSSPRSTSARDRLSGSGRRAASSHVRSDHPVHVDLGEAVGARTRTDNGPVSAPDDIEVIGEPSSVSAAQIAAERVAEVRDSPQGRLDLLRSSYAPLPGAAPLHLRYRRARSCSWGGR